MTRVVNSETVSYQVRQTSEDYCLRLNEKNLSVVASLTVSVSDCLTFPLCIILILSLSYLWASIPCCAVLGMEEKKTPDQSSN